MEKFKQVALSGQIKIYKKPCLFSTIRSLKRNNFNTSCPNPGRREKIELNFHFHTLLYYLKKGFMKAIQLSEMHWTGRVKTEKRQNCWCNKIKKGGKKKDSYARTKRVRVWSKGYSRVKRFWVSQKLVILSFFIFWIIPSQPAFTCSELTIETLEQGVKYVQS